MSTRVTPAICTAEREQKCRPHFVVTFCRRGPRVSVAKSDYSASAETRKPIYRIRRCCNATSEYSPMRSIGLTLTNIHPFNGPLSGTTRVNRYEKGKTNLGFAEARDSEWQWHQLGHMQVCTSLQTDYPPLSFLQAGCPSCRPTNSVKALKLLR